MFKFQMSAKLIKEPRQIETKTGTAMCVLVLADLDGKREAGEKYYKSTIIEGVVFGKTAEFSIEYLKPQDRLIVEGDIYEESWQDGEGKTAKRLKFKISSLSKIHDRVLSQERDIEQQSLVPKINLKTKTTVDGVELEESEVPF